jgi:tRNA splicing ligase
MIASVAIQASHSAVRSVHSHVANVSADVVAVFLPFDATGAVVPLGIDRIHQRSNNHQGNDRNQIHLAG